MHNYLVLPHRVWIFLKISASGKWSTRLLWLGRMAFLMGTWNRHFIFTTNYFTAGKLGCVGVFFRCTPINLVIAPTIKEVPVPMQWLACCGIESSWLLLRKLSKYRCRHTVVCSNVVTRNSAIFRWMHVHMGLFYCIKSYLYDPQKYMNYQCEAH
jgi:hypothetical protein